MASKHSDLLKRLDSMSEQELRRQLAYQLTEKSLGLVWERDHIEHDRALNANAVLPRLSVELSQLEPGESTGNMIIEGVDLLPSLSFLGSCRLRRKGRGFPGCRLPGSCFAVRCLQCLGIAGLTQTQQASIPEGPSVFAATLGTGE
ncbi:hypothetical protein ACTXK7_14540 [Vreelandella alkaliphila]|uniref:hypothetical protein n=1 Tax=Vreelandella alkaliphila TaxID=272774 RepID=UPI003FD75172